MSSAVASDDEEPILKYQRLGASVSQILMNDAASCIGVHEAFIALGTFDGALYILDFQGNEIRRFHPHSKKLNDVSIDALGEFAASCSDDGTIVVNALQSSKEQSLAYNHYRPVKGVRLDPHFARKREKLVVAGGLAGQLIAHRKGWLMANDQILHEGEGPIHCVQWRGELVAWANDWGVKVYDIEHGERVTYIERPRSCPPIDVCTCHLFWEDDSTLLIGWADTIQILRVRRSRQREQRRAPHGGAAAADGSAGGAAAGGAKGGASARLFAEIVRVFRVDYIVCGISSWDETSLAVLAYIPSETEFADVGEAQADGGSTTRDSESGADDEEEEDSGPYRPEIHIISRDSGDDISCDALPIRGFEHYRASDYRLQSTATTAAHVPNSSALGVPEEQRSLTPTIYILSPKDVVVARARDVDDRVQWALDGDNFEEALRIAEEHRSQLRVHQLQELAEKYLGHLLANEEFERAGKLCPRLLHGDAVLWERWVVAFHQYKQLAAIAPHVPTSQPRLNLYHYDIILRHFLDSRNDHMLLQMICKWPKPRGSRTGVSQARRPGTGTEPAARAGATKDLYDLDAWIVRLEHTLLERRSHDGPIVGDETVAEGAEASAVLMNALAELYIAGRQFDKALELYLQQGAKCTNSAHVFELVEQHELWESARQHVRPLVMLAPDKAVTMLVGHINSVPATEVVQQLHGQREFQHKYLDHLFLKDRDEYICEANASLHELQVRPHHLFNRILGRNSPFCNLSTSCNALTNPCLSMLLQLSLYAEFAPDGMLPFLRARPFVKNEHALQMCERHEPQL